MKKIFFAFMAASLLTACSSPVLKWIDTPGEKEVQNGEEGRIAGLPEDKEILSFSFDIEGERVLPFGDPDSTGKIPISIILPMDTPVTALVPQVVFIGKSLSPPSGEARDFSGPVVYTVFAEDGSHRDYIVKVYSKGSDAKAIIRFALDLSQTGTFTLAAEGIIDEAAGLITLSVPAATPTGALSAEVTHTGVSVRDPMNGSRVEETFRFTGNFSAPTSWTVTAQDQTTKTYTVTVIREKSDDKEITVFSLGLGPGEEVIIGAEPQPDGKYPILAILPPGTQSSVFPRIPFINYTGTSISPGPAISLDFNQPVPVSYTVTAENRSTRDYVVKLISREAPDTTARITGFYFMDPLVEGVIDQDAKTIALQVPAGTSLNALRPEIYFDGASLSPPSGQARNFSGSQATADLSAANPVSYTVLARDGTTKVEYAVSVFVTEGPAKPTVDVPGTEEPKVDIGTNPANPENPSYNIIIEFPIYIDQPTININYPGSNSPITINNEVDFDYTEVINNIKVEDNDSSTEYNVVVVNPPETPPAPPDPTLPPSSDASIDGFYFTSPAAIGEIDITAGNGTFAHPYAIKVAVPYGTNVQNLMATVCYTGKEIAGIPGPNPLKDGARSFANEVNYTVNAEDGSAKTYRVSVTVAQNSAKEITALSFAGGIPVTALIAAGPNAAGLYPIEVTVPSTQSLTGLKPVVTITGKALSSALGGFNSPYTVGPGAATASVPVDFSGSVANPVPYEVKAADGSSRTYAVTVRNLPSAVDEPEITGFYFTEPLAVGTINQTGKIITVVVPSGTNRGNLRPTVFFKGLSVNPGSGTAMNFNAPATYTVTGIGGKTETYTVMVNPTPSSAKDIVRFQFPGIANTETVIGAVPDADGTYPISAWVPGGTALENLAPAISHTGLSINPAGGIPRDFYGSPSYTVTAEDGSVKTYTVRVGTLSGSAKLISSFIFDEVPLGGSLPPARVVASIDQSAHSIRAVVPHNADISALKPTLTWIGKLLRDPGGGTTTANPFTDTGGRNFSGSQTYTVEDQAGGTQGYSVEVIRQSSVSVRFEGEIERRVIADNTFDQNTGVITVTVNSGEVDGPYEWYVNGVKQPVAAGETSLSLHVGDGSFIPGRHEIMVSGWKGLHYTGKVYFVVSGGGL
jgi:hypothetical protein